MNTSFATTVLEPVPHIPATNQVSSISSSDMGANPIAWSIVLCASSSTTKPSKAHDECQQPEAKGIFPDTRRPPSTRRPLAVGEITPQTRKSAGFANTSSWPRSDSRLATHMQPPVIIVTQLLDAQPLASSAQALNEVASGTP